MNFRTNDEILWDIFKCVVMLPTDEYLQVCELIAKEKSMSHLRAGLIGKADNIRKEVEKKAIVT